MYVIHRWRCCGSSVYRAVAGAHNVMIAGGLNRSVGIRTACWHLQHKLQFLSRKETTAVVNTG